jgi:hypothetical protein
MADDHRRMPNWRTTGGREPGRPQIEPGKKRPGGRKRLALLGAFLAVIGVVLGLLTLLNRTPRPIFLGMAVTEYAHYPPNAWAQQDSDALRALFGTDSEQAFTGQERHLLLQKLNELTDRTSTSAEKGRPVIVHLTGLAVPWGGKVHLLPGNADPSAPASWLPLSDVLSALARGKGPRFLLLDVARPIADARLGVLNDDVALVLDAELTQAEAAGNLPFFVLTACGPGQFSRTSPDLQRSIFGYFIEQGLLGRADGWGGTQRDDRVSARELSEYVRVHVAQWAENLHLPAQTPVLYGKGTDFVMIAPKAPPPRELPVPEPRKPPEILTGAWAERDRWAAEGTASLAPRTFRHLEEAALRAERRWLAGGNEENLRRSLGEDVTNLAKRRQELLPRSITPRSLAEARLKVKGDVKIPPEARQLLARLQSPSPPNPMELAEALKALNKPAPDPASKAPAEALPAGALELAGLAALTSLNDPSTQQLAGFDSYFATFFPDSRPAELLLIRYLLDHKPRELERWQEEKLTTAKALILRSGAAAERACVVDPRTARWLADGLENANQLRRDGIILLSTSESAQKRIEGINKLEEALRKYDNLCTAGLALEWALAAVDRALLLLPAVVPALTEGPVSQTEERLWSATVAAILKLQDLLSSPDAKPQLPTLPELNSASESLDFQFRSWVELFQDEELSRLLKRAGSGAELRRTLRAPVWSGPSRSKLLAEADQLDGNLINEAREKSIALQPGASPPNSPNATMGSPAWRARVAIDLLRLGGLTDTKPLEARLEQVKAKNPPDQDAWEQLGLKIREAWAEQLPARFSDFKTPCPAQRQAGFIVHPFDVSALPLPLDRFSREPAAELRRDETSNFWRWLAERRYQEDAKRFGAFSNRPELTSYGKGLAEVANRIQERNP